MMKMHASHMVNTRNMHKMFATTLGSFLVMTLNVSEFFYEEKNQK